MAPSTSCASLTACHGGGGGRCCYGDACLTMTCGGGGGVAPPRHLCRCGPDRLWTRTGRYIQMSRGTNVHLFNLLV